MTTKATNSPKGENKSTHKIGFFGFFAITASMVMTVYEYPSFATSGFQLVFFSNCWRRSLVFTGSSMLRRNGNGGRLGIRRYLFMGGKYTWLTLGIFGLVLSVVSGNSRIRNHGIFYTGGACICI